MTNLIEKARANRLRALASLNEGNVIHLGERPIGQGPDSIRLTRDIDMKAMFIRHTGDQPELKIAA